MKNHRSLSFLSLLAVGASALLLGACSTLEQPYDVVAYKPTNPNNVEVKLSLENQAIYVMEGDRPLLVTAACVGKSTHRTPKGRFRVQVKQIEKRSGTYGLWVKGDTVIPGRRDLPPGSGFRYVGHPLPYWVQFKPLYGFHEGAVWPEPRSHGCVRVHRNVAPKLYHLVRIGTPVHVADRHPEDQTLGKDLRRPTDYNEPGLPLQQLLTSAAFVRPQGPLLVDATSPAAAAPAGR